MNGKANFVKVLTVECRKCIIIIIMVVHFSVLSLIALQGKVMVPIVEK